MKDKISNSISVFGLGYVGCVSVACLADAGYKVIGVDVKVSKVDLINKGVPTIIEPGLDELMYRGFKEGRIIATTDVALAVQSSEIMLITVGTPSTESGGLDLSHLYDVARDIGENLKFVNEFRVIVIRSTVKPNTCFELGKVISSISGKLNGINFAVVSNPEFLREGTAISDYMNPPYILIGTEHEHAAKKIEDIYRNVNASVLRVKLSSAEIIKYVNNSWHALKVSFANEIGSVCSALGVDAFEVMDLFCRDTILNLSSYYLRPGFCYGGACLPKDLAALAALSIEANVDAPLLNSITRSNEAHINRAISLIRHYDKKIQIGILGVGFKNGTDDVRGSAALKIIRQLITDGYQVKIYDDIVMSSIATGRNNDALVLQLEDVLVNFVNTVEEILDFSQIIVIAKNDKNFQSILDEFDGETVVDLVGYAWVSKGPSKQIRLINHD